MAPYITQLHNATVLVTGATGFTGSHLVRRLTECGATIRAIARPSSDRAPLDAFPVEWFIGEVYDPATITRAMDGVQYVFHMATLYRSPSASEDDHRKVHVTSTELLARTALLQPAFKRFVHLSTVGVHGHIMAPPADETAPFRPGDEYQRTKVEAEKWLRPFAAEEGLPYAIVRPAGIYGPGDRRLLKVFRMAARRVCPILGKRPCLYHLIHVRDLTEVIRLAAVHPAAEGEVFIAGNPDPIPLDVMLRIIAAALERNVRIIRLPITPFLAMAGICETVCRPLGIRPLIYRRRIKFFQNDRAFDTRKLQQRLGFECAHTNETGLTETARWYRERAWL